jgi:hypothetical protein
MTFDQEPKSMTKNNPRIFDSKKLSGDQLSTPNTDNPYMRSYYKNASALSGQIQSKTQVPTVHIK